MGRAAVASTGETRFKADQPRSGDGTAPQFVTVLSRRRDRLRGLRHAHPYRACGEAGGRTRLGGPSGAPASLISVEMCNPVSQFRYPRIASRVVIKLAQGDAASLAKSTSDTTNAAREHQSPVILLL